jgi:CheY-like chemotaxis protein
MTRILVIEDEPEIRENVQALLELEGYSVAAASNGREALAELQNDAAFDLILLDLSMPVMSGSEFLDETAKNLSWAKIPVCITTGVAELPHFNRPVDILRKPISFQNLITRIRQSSHPDPLSKQAA